ncbi:GTPase [uncultured Anaerococcus sp.]|uniref:YcjF family protein n=1 Tax=uncultured Anaerococcus sp. TaxID=293428 RepID=UPI0028051662|nr:GTPase [uncultured Anaerococcus sp.]
MLNDLGKVAQDTIDAINEKIQNLSTLNIIVAGKTGVGKSTLINAVFKDELAETGMGRPVTNHMRKITKKDIPLAIYDTRGFELGKDVQEDVKKEVFDTINKGLATKDINKAIHCIWYCINTASNRIEPEEIEWLRELSRENHVTQVPIIVVLTQSISRKNAEKMRQMILDENLNIIQVIPVLAKDFEIEDVGIVKSFGLEKLIEVMGEALPDELLDTLQHVQIASLSEKKRRASKVVATAALAATGQGAAPIPFADATLLIPTQVGMIASITVIFGFDVNKSVITALLSSTIGSGGATLLGRAVVANILKLLPAAGSIAGGAISAGTAGVITAALGSAYIAFMELVYKGEMNIEDLSSKEGKETIANIFKENLKNGRENLMKFLDKSQNKEQED